MERGRRAFTSPSDRSRRLDAASQLETASISSIRSLASVWAPGEAEAPLGSQQTAAARVETAAADDFSASPVRWQVALPLAVALVVLLRRIHRYVGARTPDKLTASSGAAALKTGDRHLLLRSDVEDARLLVPPNTAAFRPKQGVRFLALDVLRGVTICLMVFVNYGGGGMPAFAHSIWDGLTIADVLFPWFAWIMGFSVFLTSAVRRKGRQTASQRRAKLRDVAARSVRLFLLGLFLNNGSSWCHWRIPGVLQALAAAYFVAAVADLTLAAVISNISTNKPARTLLIPHLALVAAPLMAVNVAITFALPVPGCPTGYIGPGGNATATMDPSDGGPPLANCTGGAHLFVDLTVFGRDHIYQTPTCQRTYATGPYDPEGLLNWLMVAATAHLGYCSALLAIGTDCGDASKSFSQRIRRVVGAGGLLITIGLLVARWTGIPINKNLWSLSFVLVCSGLATIALALTVVVVGKTDRFSTASASTSQQWAWTCARYPWAFVGTNSVVIYAMHEICQSYAPFSPKSLDGGDEHVPQLELVLFNLVGVAWWIHVAAWLHQRGVVVKI